jgi:hypothetical protein
MKLVGYIKEKKENSFRIPVYTNSKGLHFFHAVDERYNITDFVAATFNEKTFQKLYLSKKFEVGKKGAIVFIGSESYLHYNDAPTAIEEIIHYLNDHSVIANINVILDEAMLLKNRIFSDHFIVDNFVMKMSPKDEHIILSFDFPSPKKESADEKNTTTVNPETSQKKERAIVLEQTSDPAFTNAIKHLDSVNMNFELKLKLRAEERRSKLKTFNYQFKLNQNSVKRKNSAEQ